MLSVFPAALGTPFPEYFPKTAKRHPLVGHLLLHDLAKRIRQVRDAKIFVALDNSLVNLMWSTDRVSQVFRLNPP
jgi:hypothetical protein